jgi:outer membrane protein assembly factor BamB
MARPKKCLLSVLLIGLVAGIAWAENWPRFRGPTGQGISAESNLPIAWTDQSHVAWKTALPGEGWSSPIVWDDHVFVTSTTDSGVNCHVICLERHSGRILWDTTVFQQVPQHKERKNSYASPTPVTDGEHVYAVFGDGSIVALDLDGNVSWTNREVKFYSRHGLGASPILYHERLIMPFDGSNRVSKAGSWPNNSDEERLGWQIPWDKAFIVALDAKSGQRLWTANRNKSRIAHVTPNILYEQGAAQIISTAGDAIQGFEPETGKLIWTVYSQGEGVTPSFAMGNGLIFTSSGFEKTTLRTVRTGGSGDVTATHIAWEQPTGAPTQPSLLYVKPYLYTVTDAGIAHCYEGETGQIVGRSRIGGNFCASPVYADGKIYFLSEAGETTIVTAGPELTVVAKNPLNERCLASIAISGGNLFIRTQSHLYCIGPPPRG